MADMVYCRGCGKEIHRTAPICPQCGAVQRARRYKSKMAAGVLALLLGGLGIHRFYLGQWRGVLYLLFFWTYIPAIVAVIEALVFFLRDQRRWDEIYNEGIPSEGTSSAATVLAVIAAVFVFTMIAGIIAAISIPAYHDYTLRARASEAVFATEPLRQAIAENPALSKDHLDRLSREAVMGSRYISDVRVTADRAILVTMGKEASGLAGETVLFELKNVDGSLVWECRGGSLVAQYRPSQCR